MTAEGSGDLADATLRDLVSGQKLFGRYTLIRILGRGGMGVVWLGCDEELERDVALKFLPDLIIRDRALLNDLKRETRRSLELTHKNIVRIYDFVHDERSGCISMEYIDGETLSNLRAEKEQKVFEPNEIGPWTRQLCDALDYAHNDAKIIHRDLKPANLMVNQRCDLKVSDFGIACSLGDSMSRLTMEQGRSGTLVYMSPQQLGGERGTHLDDIYSLGATIYDLLTSKPPFYSGNIDRQIHERVAPSMTERRKELDIEPALVPPVWEDAVAACLAKDPSRRPQSAAEVVQRLQLTLGQTRAITTVPAKSSSRKVLLGAGVAALIFLALLVGLFWWVGIPQRREAVRTAAMHQGAGRPSGASLPIPEKSIAVLPLENLSEEKENAFFADGIQDELLSNLAKIKDLKVISRTSVMQYKSGITRNLKEIAQQLGVSNVVEGSVRRAGNHIRVSVQLIDALTDRHIWVQNYDRTLADSLVLQGELATEIAAGVGATLSPQEKARVEAKPTNNLAAYDAYLRARAFAAGSPWDKSTVENAIHSYQEAVKLDPSFVLAWARLSYAQSNSYWLGLDPSPAQLAAAKDAADHALALDPDLPETHLALGYYRYYGQRDFTGGLAEFQQAQKGLPNNVDIINAIALIQRRLGHWEEAIDEFRRVVELDPRDINAYLGLAATYGALRRFPEDLAMLDRILALEPTNELALALKASVFWATGDLQAVEPLLANSGTEPRVPGGASPVRGVQALFQRRYAAAIEILSSAVAAKTKSGEPSDSEKLLLGLGQQRAGDVAAARATYQSAAQDIRRELEKVVPGSKNEAQLHGGLGLAYAGLGEAAPAIAEGQKAMAMHPTSKDPFEGPDEEENMANIYALLGDADHAIPILKRLLEIPHGLAITPAFLRLDPVWDQIRNDPRFQELAAERATISTPPQAQAAAIPEKSIAVLPFDNLSEEKANAYFADGIQDEILTKLTSVGDLKVISRISTAKYKSKPEDLKTVARELGVATVLEGSVQKAAGKVRVNVQLLDARVDTHLWAKSYDRDLKDVFAVESEVAQEIADALRAKLSPSQSNALATAPTRDTEAYDLFLKGEYQEQQAESAPYLRAELFDRAQTFYRQAVARDPGFALAYARLSYSRLNRHWFINSLTSAQLQEVKSDIERALTIAPDSPEAHLTLGLFNYWVSSNFDSALRALDRAVELQPNNSVSRQFRGAIYRRRGEWRRSLAEYERALELDPRDAWIPHEIGMNYIFLRRWSDAEHAFARALALDPQHLGGAFHLADTYINSTGDIRRARQAWEGIPGSKLKFNPLGILSCQMIGEFVYLDVLERHFAEALKAWDAAPTNTAEGRLNQLKARVGIQVLAGQNAAAKRDCEEARVLLEAQLAQRQPEDRTSVTELAWVYVCLGRNADALRIAQEATESMPIEKDALNGVEFLAGLAQIEAHTGRPEEAVRIIRQLLTIPAGEYVSVALLKIDPVWDPIRDDPRFQKLLSEPEPETVYK